MILLIFELNKKYNKDELEFQVGDILVFYNNEEYDYYQAVYNPFDLKYYLLCLTASLLYDTYTSLNQLIKDANDPLKNNNFKLIEVLKSNEVVLKRIEE